MQDSEEKYIEARKKVKKIKDFYTHLMVFIVVNLFLFGVNWYTIDLQYPWFLWVLFGWGIGLAFDYLKAFDKNPMFNKDWEERKINEYMNKEREQQRWE
ncbi:2TM domain-containing protein [Zunongwangia sp. HRR-M8]|uniref:2TM domain-containing protein n=1 Tax=Zunongwangia sp. HRR-M8 TaxID=3015170 RepID=UPI0022DDAC88|nr:2TM domain-containing protein [Zunongwangia sp. HRR-M8]WBL21018.1 2TM domain-containing protein [Zunongwangia sp. HRR-M8]